jgi:hypothetical protein
LRISLREEPSQDTPALRPDANRAHGESAVGGGPAILAEGRSREDRGERSGGKGEGEVCAKELAAGQGSIHGGGFFGCRAKAHFFRGEKCGQGVAGRNKKGDKNRDARQSATLRVLKPAPPVARLGD